MVTPIYEWLSERGYRPDAEHVFIEGLPAQFRPAHNASGRHRGHDGEHGGTESVQYAQYGPRPAGVLWDSMAVNTLRP
jgi:hypothetical protein